MVGRGRWQSSAFSCFLFYMCCQHKVHPRPGQKPCPKITEYYVLSFIYMSVLMYIIYLIQYKYLLLCIILREDCCCAGLALQAGGWDCRKSFSLRGSQNPSTPGFVRGILKVQSHFLETFLDIVFKVQEHTTTSWGMTALAGEVTLMSLREHDCRKGYGRGRPSPRLSAVSLSLSNAWGEGRL